MPLIFKDIKETAGTSEGAKTLLVIMPRDISTRAKESCRTFFFELLEKWRNMTRRNLTETGPHLDQADIWEKKEVPDLYKKDLCNKGFNVYKDMFTFATDVNDELK